MAITPAAAATLVQKGFDVHVEEGAGLAAQFRNEDYEKSGAKISQKMVVFQSGIHFFLISHFAHTEFQK